MGIQTRRGSQGPSKECYSRSRLALPFKKPTCCCDNRWALAVGFKFQRSRAESVMDQFFFKNAPLSYEHVHRVFMIS